MRRSLLALAVLIAAAACATTSAAQTLTGVWAARGELGQGQQHYEPESRDYFTADLTEQDDRLSGDGVINLCPTCRGFDEYAIHWEGRRKGGRFVMRGVYPERTFETPVVFTGRISADGARVDGELTDDDGRVRSWVMIRQPNTSTEEEAR